MLPTTVQILYMMLAPYNLPKRRLSTPYKARTASLLYSTARKLLGRQQLIGTK